MTKSALRILGKWLLSADLYKDKSVYWTQRIFGGEYIKGGSERGEIEHIPHERLHLQQLNGGK